MSGWLALMGIWLATPMRRARERGNEVVGRASRHSSDSFIRAFIHAPPALHPLAWLISGSITRSSGTWRGRLGSPSIESTPAPMLWIARSLGHCLVWRCGGSIDGLAGRTEEGCKS